MSRKSSSAAVALRDRINQQMRKPVVTMGNDPHFTIRRVSTGSLVLDRLTGGGFARGRHVVLYGDFLVGKSLTLYRTMALAQQRGETCGLVDAENVFNERWFRQVGGVPEDLVLYPDRDGDSTRDANELGTVLRTMLERGEGFVPADVVGIDSVASLLPTEELEHDLEDGDPRVASLARLMPLLLRMLTTKNDDTLFIWTNQWRDKIGRVPGLRSTPGGRALGFFASTMIEMVEGEKETEPRVQVVKGREVERKVTVGRWVTCTARKEKTGGRPYATRSFLLDYDTRLPDAEREIIDLGLEDGLIEYRGARYHLRDASGAEHSFHGAARLKERLAADDELREFLVACVEERTIELAEGDDGAE